MQTLSASLKAALIDIDARSTPRQLVDLVELYDPSYVPGASGFDPASSVERFASETITWNGRAYRREVESMGRSDVSRSMGQDQNNVSLLFSNISRYLATLAQSRTMEGMFLVIRTVNPSVTDDSIVLFTGRLDKPSTIDKQSFTIAARQDFGAINIELPTQKFLTTDPNNRVPSDPLFEGFRIVPVAGSFVTQRSVPSTSFWGRLFGRQRAERVNEQYSSFDDTPYGSPVPEVFGSCQMEGVPLIFIDYGSITRGIWVWSKGPISGIDNVIFRNAGQILRATTHHLGDLGGTGSNATQETDIAVGIGYLSLTAYTALGWNSLTEEVDEMPTVVALIRGRLIDLPDGSGVYNLTGWSDNPAHIARYVMTNSRFMNINPAFMEDAVGYLTSQHCDEPLIDDTNSQIITIPSPDLPQAGDTFYRYQATGILNPRHFLYYDLGDASIIPENVDGPYTSIDPTNVPTTFTIDRILRKRYTANVPITGSTRAVDFLYETLFPAFKGFLRVNKKGKYEIRSERSADSTRLRTATAVGATSVPIDDVTPWKSGPDLLTGRILLGTSLTTSEVRDVLTADYSAAGNSVTLAASKTGTITATASGATLTGGSTTVQASGTVTIGGTPAAGNTVTVTINGIAVTYTLTAEDTTGTVAAMLTNFINATPRLRGFIKATWSSASPTVITIKAKYGALNLSSQLLKTHAIGIADPSAAPTVAAAGAGALAAGTYYVAYADVTSYGLTALTPVASVVLAINQQIALSALPALTGSSRQFFISEEIGSQRLRYSTTRTNNANFNINALPLANAALPPSVNTTSEELIRVAMSFATNSQDVLPAWKPAYTPVLNDIYLPTSLNGHKYTATTVGGPTGTTEPTWPLTAGGTVVDGGVTWTESGETVMGQAGLTRANIIKDTFNWPMGSEQSSINQIKISFRDRKNDFALTPYLVNDYTHQTQVGKPYPMEIDGSAIDNFHQMFRISNGALAKYRDGDWFATWGTGPQGLVLEEGDVVCVSDDSGGLINVPVRIESLSIGTNHDVTIQRARKYSTNMFSDDARAQTVPIPSNLRFTETADTIFELIDNSALRDADALIPGFYVAGSRDLATLGDWRGYVLYADYGDGYLPIASGDVPAIMGTATTTLGTVTDPSVWDKANSITFTLKYGDETDIGFVTQTKQEILTNPRRNLFLVGNEYIQAATVVDNGNLSFTLSTLLRGRFGTDTPTQLTHGASERVVFLNGAEVFVPIDPVHLNGSYNYKAVTTNQDVADATPVAFIWTGGTATPLSPSNIKGERNQASDLLIQWTRRSRFSPGLTVNTDVPVGEEAAEFMVEIYSGTTLKRTLSRLTVGKPMIAVLEGDYKSKFTDITINSVSVTSVSTSRKVRSLQRINEPNNFIEATLLASSSTATATRVYFGVLATNKDWRNVATTDINFCAQLRHSTLSAALEFIEGGTSTLYTEDASSYATTGVRVRLELTHEGIKFYKNYSGSGSQPLAVSSLPINYPFYCFIFINTATGTVTGKANDVILTNYPQPTAIYTAAQQVTDFGSAQSSVKIRVYQVSSIVGRGRYAEATI